MNIIFFNKDNECNKQNNIAPSEILYSGLMQDVPESIIYNEFGGYEQFINIRRLAKENELYCIITSQKQENK